MLSPKHRPRPGRRYALLALVLLLVLYVVVPQLSGFRSSWHLLSHPRPDWLALAVFFTGVTYLSAAGTYYWLAFKRLGYWQAVTVQLAVMFINRLLPAGIGGLGGNYYYLHKRGHTSAQAAVVVAINNLLGVVGHVLLLLVALAVGGWQGLAVHHGTHSVIRYLAYACLAIVAVTIGFLAWGQAKARRFLKQIRQQLWRYRQRTGRLSLALLTSMSLTLANVLAFYYCSLALGIHLTVLSALLVFSLGASAGSAIPTPGGLGGFEAGLVAGLSAYHVAGAPALAVALLYRLVSYWLPLLAGGVALAASRRLGWL